MNVAFWSETVPVIPATLGNLNEARTYEIKSDGRRSKFDWLNWGWSPSAVVSISHGPNVERIQDFPELILEFAYLTFANTNPSLPNPDIAGEAFAPAIP